MTPFSERANRAIAALRKDIEALATEVRFSDLARNDTGDLHTVIANGVVKQEGAPYAPWPGLKEACANSLAIAQTLSAHHRGDTVTLFWRIVPEWEDDTETGQPLMYMRLSFANNVP